MPASKRAKYGAPMPEAREADVADVDEEADWVPPVNQSGDGKTSLNAKFGY